MDLKGLARLLGSLVGQMNELEESVKQGLMRRLEVDKLLLYNMPDAEREDVNELEEMVKRALGGDSLEEAIRNALKAEKRRRIRMGGRRLAIIFSGGELEGDRSIPLAIMERLEVRGNVRKFDASSYPLATLQEVVEFDPDVVVIVSVERGERASIVKERMDPEVPADRLEAGDLIAPPLLGVNDPESLASALIAMMGSREVWKVVCLSPHVEGDGISEVGRKCSEDLKKSLEELIRELGF